MFVVASIKQPQIATLSAKYDTGIVWTNTVDAETFRRLGNVDQEFSTHGANKDITFFCSHDQLDRVFSPSMASVILGDIVTTVWHELRVHLSNVSEVVFNLHVLIGAGAGYDADHVRHNLSQRYLERRDLVVWIDNIKINFG